MTRFEGLGGSGDGDGFSERDRVTRRESRPKYSASSWIRLRSMSEREKEVFEGD